MSVPTVSFQDIMLIKQYADDAIYFLPLLYCLPNVQFLNGS